MFYKPKPSFGLDISDISLKLFQFGRVGERRVVSAYSDVSIPAGTVTSDRILDGKALTAVIRESLRSPKFGKIISPHVVASIPETKCFVRVIHMPQMSEAEAREAVLWEAEAYIPMPVGQVYLDFQILGTSPAAKGGEAKMKVLITAAPKDYIDAYVAVLKTAGLVPVALEAESQATARSLVANSDEAVLIADVDTVRTSLIIYNKGVLEFTSSVPIAGNSFTEAISKALTVEFDEAEKRKRLYGLDITAEKGKIVKALLPQLAHLAAEIRNTIRFHEEHSPDDAQISRILLAGGSAKLRFLSTFLKEQLLQNPDGQEHPLRSLPGIKVDLGNPWGRVLKKREVPPISPEDSLSFATAIGLALREEEGMLT